MKDSFKGEIIQSLPDQGKDPVFHLFLILRIALQSFFQNLFLNADPLGNHRKISKHDEKRNGGCENQRHSKEQDCRGHVHRMPDNPATAKDAMNSSPLKATTVFCSLSFSLASKRFLSRSGFLPIITRPAMSIGTKRIPISSQACQ